MKCSSEIIVKQILTIELTPVIESEVGTPSNLQLFIVIFNPLPILAISGQAMVQINLHKRKKHS